MKGSEGHSWWQGPSAPGPLLLGNTALSAPSSLWFLSKPTWAAPFVGGPGPSKVRLWVPARSMPAQLVGVWKGRSTRNPGGGLPQTLLGKKALSLGSGVPSCSARGRSLGPVATPGGAQLHR